MPGLFLSHSNLWTQHFVTFFNLKNHIKLLEMLRLRLHPVILFDQSAEELWCLVGRMTGWHCNISYITENYQEGSQSVLVQALTIAVFAVSWPGQGRAGQGRLRDNKSYIHQDLQAQITDTTDYGSMLEIFQTKIFETWEIPNGKG